MKIFVPQNSFVWTPNGLAFPKDITLNSEIFLVDPNLKLYPYIIQDEITEKNINVSTIITQQSTLTIPNEYLINAESQKLNIQELKNAKFLPTNKHIIYEFIEYFKNNLERFSDNFFNIVIARYMGRTFYQPNKQLPYLIPKDDSDEEFRNLGIELGKIFDKNEVFGKFEKNLSGYDYKSGSTKHPYKIYIENSNYSRIREGIDFRNDKIEKDIYSSGLNSFLHFHKNAVTIGFLSDFDCKYKEDSITKKVDLLINLPWNSKFRKIFQNTCIFDTIFKITTLAQDEDYLSVTYDKSLSTIPVIEKIINHESQCIELDIPMNAKIILDNYLISPVEIDLDEKRDDLKKYFNFFESIRKEILQIDKENTKEPRKIKEIQYRDIGRIHLIGRIINHNYPKRHRLRNNITKTKLEGTIEDESGKINFVVWFDEFLTRGDLKDGETLLYIPIGYIKNNIIKNSFNSKIVLLDSSMKRII